MNETENARLEAERLQVCWRGSRWSDDEGSQPGNFFSTQHGFDCLAQEFQSSMCAADWQLEADDTGATTVATKTTQGWSTVAAAELAGDECHFSEVTIKRTSQANINVGVCTTDVDTATNFQEGEKGWSLFLNDCGLYHNGENCGSLPKFDVSPDDRVGIMLNKADASLSYFINGELIGVAFFIGLDVTKPLHVAVGTATTVICCDSRKVNWD